MLTFCVEPCPCRKATGMVTVLCIESCSEKDFTHEKDVSYSRVLYSTKQGSAIVTNSYHNNNTILLVLYRTLFKKLLCRTNYSTFSINLKIPFKIQRILQQCNRVLWQEVPQHHVTHSLLPSLCARGRWERHCDLGVWIQDEEDGEHSLVPQPSRGRLPFHCLPASKRGLHRHGLPLAFWPLHV